MVRKVSSRSRMKVGDICKLLTEHGLRVYLVGDENLVIKRVNTLELAEEGDITFLANRKYIKQIYTTKASAIILPETVSGPENLTQLKVDDPYYAFALVMEKIHGHRRHPLEGIDPSAKIDSSAKIGKGARIGANVVICKGVVIGKNAVIYPNCFIGPDCKIGDNLILYPNVVIYEGVIIGNNVTVHSGTVIGEDGFGYATHNGVHHKIPQVGNVIIEDDVEIGSNCTIDRATIGSTIIGRGTKLSNLIAIGHGTQIGQHCLMVAQVGIAGSTKVGDYVTMGGQVGVVGHIRIGNRVTIGAKSGVVNNIEDDQTVLGAPAVPIQEAKRKILLTGQLPEFKERIKQLTKRVEQLEKLFRIKQDS